MTFWVVDVDIRAGEAALTDEAAIDFAEALARQPVLGSVVGQNLRDQTIGARFDVRVATAEEALAVGREAFRQVLAEAGLGEGGLVRLLVEADEDTAGG